MVDQWYKSKHTGKRYKIVSRLLLLVGKNRDVVTFVDEDGALQTLDASLFFADCEEERAEEE